MSIAPTSAIDQTTSNNLPNVYATVPGALAANAPNRGVGFVQSGTSTTPFTVEAISVTRRGGTKGHAILRLALTNNGSNVLDAAGQFTTGLTDLADAHAISGVYLVDPSTQISYKVARPTETKALCTNVDPPLNTGERRLLESEFPALPASTKKVSVYFPHASPMNDVPVY